MADQPVTREKLINADKDVQVIEDFIKKPKDETVTTRFGDEIMTLKGLEDEVKKSGGYFKRYISLAAANADLANIPVNSVVKVTDAVDGGDYEKAAADATSLTKSDYDPVRSANEYAQNLIIPLSKIIENLGTSDAHLLNSIQEILNTIIQFRNDYDADIPALSATVSSNSQSVNTDLTKLLLSIQQITQIIGENRDEVDALFTNLTTTSTFNENANSKIFVSIQTFVSAFNDFINETDRFFDEDEKLKRNYINQQIYVELMKLQNFDPEVVGSNKYVESESIVFLPVPSNVIRIDIETSNPLPVAKGTVINTTTSINVDGQIIKNFSTLEVQGSSSAGFPKKNWTLALFADAARTSPIEIKLGHMMPHDELVWKANLVDNTQSRNLAVNRLWDQMLLARSGFPKREVDYVNMVGGVGLNYTPTGALGHVDGFQAVVYINKEFYGIGSLNIGKKRGNYNLASNNQKQIQLEPQGNVNYTAMPSSPTNTDSGLEIRRPSTWGLEAQGYYERLVAWMAKSRADMEADGIDNFFNRQNLMDYIILAQVCDLWDHMGKNAEITTWDGQIWNFLPYDCDTVFGLWWTGTIINPATGVEWRPAANLLITQNTSEGPVGFFSKCRRIYGTDIDARYAELRHKKIIDVENITSICSELLRKFPQKLLKAEDTKWNTGGSDTYSGLVQSSSIYQINTWLTVRIAAVDAYFNYTA